MKINIYTGYEDFKPRGTFTISYDRIVHINIIMPNGNRGFSIHKYLDEMKAEKTGEAVNSFSTYDKETSYKIAIKKLSKADIPYRKEKLTHQVLCNDFNKEIRDMHLYTKLKWWEVMRMNYSLRKYMWQTKEFKKHIFYYIATSGIGFIGGLLLGWGIWYKSISPTEKKETQQTIDSTKMINPKKYDTSSFSKDAKIQPVTEKGN